MRVLAIVAIGRADGAVRRALVGAGHVVESAGDGAAGLAAAAHGAHDVIIVDATLPDGAGALVCRQLREQRVLAPILLLTEPRTSKDQRRTRPAGTNDVLAKPFALGELLARVRVLAEPGGNGNIGRILRVGDLALDLAAHEVRRGDRAIPLTAKEFALLRHLLEHADRVLPEAQILEYVWGYDSDATSNVVEIYISFLRAKIDRDFERPLIRTVRGIGYTLRAG